MSRPPVKINVKRCNRLKQIIDETKVKQCRLSELTGISQQAISNMVQCKANVTETTARAVVEVFPQYNFEWLMGQSDYKTAMQQRLSTHIPGFIAKKTEENAVNGFMKAYGLYFAANIPGIPTNMSIEELSGLSPQKYEMLIGNTKAKVEFALCREKSQEIVAILSQQEYNNFVSDINDYVEFKFDKLFKQKGGTDG